MNKDSEDELSTYLRIYAYHTLTHYILNQFLNTKLKAEKQNYMNSREGLPLH